PTIFDPNLAVREAATGLDLPTTMAFLGRDDLLVLEKETGQVKRVVHGSVQNAPVLDLPVNFYGQRGLLGITLHPDFPKTPYVYLYWTESSTGQDTEAADEVPLLGNRVDRFRWDGSALTLDQPILRLRALQTEPPPQSQAVLGNHNGGVL